MRRALTLLSLGSVVVGTELATAAFSTAAARFVAGARALASGSESFVPRWAFVTGVAMVAGGALLAGMLLWSGRAAREVDGVGRACPRCGTKTKRTRRRSVDRLLAFLMRETLTRRRCDECGWTGLAIRP